jgi:hypothetical protein
MISPTAASSRCTWPLPRGCARPGTARGSTPRPGGADPEFTGISDPYEAPDDAEMVIDTRETTALEAAEAVLTRLEAEGYVR